MAKKLSAKNRYFCSKNTILALFHLILAPFRLILDLFGQLLTLFNTQTPKYAGSYRVRFLDISKISGKIS